MNKPETTPPTYFHHLRDGTAYEAGRALRMIGHIMDAEGSPPDQGQGFLSQLADAVLFFALRQERQPWGAEDTAFVFLERAQGPKEAIEAMRRGIVDYARGRPELKPRTGG